MIQTNCDGGSRGNPGPAAIGVVIRKGSQILKKHGVRVENSTSNVAEYKALMKTLEMAREFDDEVTCNLDSELIVNQLLGKYKVRNERLLPLFLKVQKLQDGFEKVKYVYVSRENEFQKMADKLVNRALDGKNLSEK